MKKICKILWPIIITIIIGTVLLVFGMYYYDKMNDAVSEMKELAIQEPINQEDFSVAKENYMNAFKQVEKIIVALKFTPIPLYIWTAYVVLCRIIYFFKNPKSSIDKKE